MDFLPWKTFHRIVDRCDGDRYVKSLFIKLAGRSNCFLSGSSSIFVSRNFTVTQKMRWSRKSDGTTSHSTKRANNARQVAGYGSPCRFMSLLPSSKNASIWRHRFTLCYRYFRSLFSRKCPSSKPLRVATTFRTMPPPVINWIYLHINRTAVKQYCTLVQVFR